MPSELIPQVLRHVAIATEQLQIPYCLIGAQALAFWLHGVYGRPVGRVSGDMDMAIVVSDWRQFARIKTELCKLADFKENPNRPQKLMFKAREGLLLPVDFVPCGDVEQNGELSWPPDHSFVMNSAGLLEVVEHAQALKIEPALEVSVATLRGIALLKLLAWQDRHLRDNKDASDIAVIARNYEAAGNLDRLYERHEDLLEASDYDPVPAGARMLARDIVEIAKPVSLQQLKQIIETPDRVSLLLAQAKQEPAVAVLLEQLEYELAVITADAKHTPESQQPESQQ